MIWWTMELKVWVDGVQRIVCGVTEVTTCQEVVIALAQAIGKYLCQLGVWELGWRFFYDAELRGGGGCTELSVEHEHIMHSAV